MNAVVEFNVFRIKSSFGFVICFRSNDYNSTALKGLIPDRRNAERHLRFCKCVATVKCRVADRCDAVRNGDKLKVVTIIEKTFRDCLYICRQINLFKFSALSEGVGANGCDIFRNNYIAKHAAARKGILSDRGHSAWNCNRSKI